MKNKFLVYAVIIFACNYSISINAQQWTTGTNLLYSSPYSTTNVGVGITAPQERLHVDNGALKIGNGTGISARTQNILKFGDADYVTIGEWEADDMLSFKANKYNFTNGNVGIGIDNPLYKLDVNGKMFLHDVNVDSAGWYHSYLLWQAHKLTMGVPQGHYAHTILELMPGGSNEGALFSQISLYHAYSSTNREERIRLCSSRDCWINTGTNLGIGTDNPLYKLDVRGTIRADEIIVNNVNGADFVFEDNYPLRPLNELQNYIQQNQHLPEIPSAQEMQENGVNINELQIQLLQKVEELTLYVIQQEQRIQELEAQISK